MWRHTLLLITCLIATRAATLSGFVWEDVNQNGVPKYIPADSQAIFIDENGNCHPDFIDGRPENFAVSNNNGEFTFVGLDPGTYDVILYPLAIYATTLIHPGSLIEMPSPPGTSRTDPVSTCIGYRVTVSDSSDNINNLNFAWAVDLRETEIVSQSAYIHTSFGYLHFPNEGLPYLVSYPRQSITVYSLFRFGISTFGEQDMLMNATLEITVAEASGDCELDLSLSNPFNPDTVTFSDIATSASIGSVPTNELIGSYQFDVLTELKNAVSNKDTEIAFQVKCNTPDYGSYRLSEANTTLLISTLRRPGHQ